MSAHHVGLTLCAWALCLSGCFRNDTSCASNDDCFNPQVCQAGSCVVFVTPDAATSDVTTDTSDARDSSDVSDTPDVGADARDASDMGPLADPWTVLAQGDIDYPVRSVLRANGDLITVFAEGDPDAFDFVTMRADGERVTPASVSTGLTSLGEIHLTEDADGALGLLYTEVNGDLMLLTLMPGASQWATAVLLPRDPTNYGFRAIGLEYVGGRLLGALAEFSQDAMNMADSGHRVLLFDGGRTVGSETEPMGGRSPDEAIPNAVNVPRSDGSMVSVWHTDINTVMFAEVDPGGEFIVKELDRGAGNAGAGYEHGRMVRAVRASGDRVWVAYVFGDDEGHELRVRTIEFGGEVTSPYLDLDLEDRLVYDLDLVMGQGEPHLVYQSARLGVLESSLELASPRALSWITRSLDPETHGARSARAHASAGGAHVVYTAHDAQDAGATQLRYQWLDL